MSISVYRGESKTLRLTVVDGARQPVNLTGAKVYFQVAQEVGGAVLVAKDSLSPPTSGVTILDQTKPETRGKADIAISAGDYTLLVGTAYQADCWVELASGERHIVVKPTDFSIRSAVRRWA